MALPICHEVYFDFLRGKKKDHPNQCSMCSNYGHLSKFCPEIKCYYCGKYGHSRKMSLNIYLHRVLKYQKNMEQIKSLNIVRMKLILLIIPLLRQDLFNLVGRKN